MSFQKEMFLYLVCLLVILNAFAPEEVMAQECKDLIPEHVCQQMKKSGKCDNPFFEDIVKMQCKKTCNKC
ncbi:hypothetical protein Y032_0059g3027 [Ancylostoma ceylanicum]|uniref:ShKT domain-containing protein n=1 Tax=Ancylostoma ceylanicum TaxID=53326 RepID=A0A016U436_9BILA|nr:hypothetical protein Y032_0059g3027 [Ancylostoma ceylanicum]